jgi:tetratricopeptide (TPR) repeat protein
VQQDIAYQISEGLRVRLTGEERKRLKTKSTESSEAYQHYLRGRYHWNKWTPDGFTRSVECFEKAIEADPDYALAWAGLSDAYGVIGYYELMPTRVAMPKARTAARRALALDDRLAEAHVTMAFTRLFADWDWAATEQEFKLALKLNSRLPSAHSFYGLFSVAAGETDVGIERAIKGRDLDPLSAIAHICVVWSLYFAREFDRALEAAHRALELDPAFIQPQMAITAIHQQRGEYQQAARMFAQHGCFWGFHVDGADRLADVLERDGVEAYHRALLARMQELGGDGKFSATAMLMAHVLAGQIDEAIARFQRMLDDHGGHCVFAFVEPSFDALRGDARFQNLLKRLEGLRSPHAQNN